MAILSMHFCHEEIDRNFENFCKYKLASINVLTCTCVTWCCQTRAWLRSKITLYLSEQDLFVGKYNFRVLAK